MGNRPRSFKAFVLAITVCFVGTANAAEPLPTFPLASAADCDAEWENINPYPPRTPLRDIWGASGEVYIVGDGGTILHYDGLVLSSMQSGTSLDLLGVYGRSRDDVYAVGAQGIVLHYDGTSWRDLGAPTTETLRAVWTDIGADVIAVGDGGTVLRYDGANWSTTVLDPTATFFGVWGTSNSLVFVSGEQYAGSPYCHHMGLDEPGLVYKYDGSTWQVSLKSVECGAPYYLRFASIWGTGANDVYVRDRYTGLVYHYNGTTWTGPTTTGLPAGWGNLPAGLKDLCLSGGITGVWVENANSIYVINTVGVIVRYDGTEWSRVTDPALAWYSWDMWAWDEDNVFAATRNSKVLRYDGVQWHTDRIETPQGSAVEFRCIWGAGPNDVWVGGYQGQYLWHYDGTGWTPVPSGNPQASPHTALWGSSSTDVYSGDRDGRVAHYDGTSWQLIGDQGSFVRDIWGSGPTDIWFVVNSDQVEHFDGQTWTSHFVARRLFTRSIYGAGPTAVFLLGSDIDSPQDLLFFYDGQSWAQISKPPSHAAGDMWVSPSSKVYVMGNGSVFSYDGSSWTEKNLAPKSSNLTALWGLDNCDVYAFGSAGRMWRYHEVMTPVVITSFRATPSQGVIVLAWDVNVDENISGFVMYRRALDGTPEIRLHETLSPQTRRFVDKDVEPGVTYEYHVAAVLADGNEVRSLPASATVPVKTMLLSQNVPNPFSPTTTIRFSIPQRTHVELAVFDAQGKRIITLVDDVVDAGKRSIQWNGRDRRRAPVATGVYFYRLAAGSTALTKKMLLIK